LKVEWDQWKAKLLMQKSKQDHEFHMAQLQARNPTHTPMPLTPTVLGSWDQDNLAEITAVHLVLGQVPLILTSIQIVLVTSRFM
jgi:hypothetical protein